MRLKRGVRARYYWAREQWSAKRPPLRAIPRLFWHDFVIHVLFEGTERCEHCGRDYVLWGTSTELWEKVTRKSGGLLCPKCFAEEARKRFGFTIYFFGMTEAQWVRTNRVEQSREERRRREIESLVRRP